MRLFCAILLVCAVPVAHADTYMPPDRAALFVHAQRLLFDDQFSQADSLLAQYVAQHPEDPAGYLMQAASLIAQMADREEQLSPARFDSLLDTAVVLTQPYLSTGSPRTRAWMYLIRGHACAYRSLYASRFGSFTTAINKGFDARAEYERGLACDSTLYDLYFGLGSFHYWKSAKAGVLRWLGFFKNDKRRGINELKLAADSSMISREASANALIWIYFDNHAYDSASTLVASATVDYPHGKSFLWPLAQAQFARKNYAASLATYTELRRRLASQPGNYFNLIECDYYLTRCHDLLDQDTAARLAAARIADYYSELTAAVARRQQSNLSYLKKMSKRTAG